MTESNQVKKVCPFCIEAHKVLDADGSQIIRNAKDGYPEGRTPRELTLAERVKALCIYADDWKRWCTDAENAASPSNRPISEQDIAIFEAYYKEASEEYFNTRSHLLDSLVNRNIYYAGYRKAWITRNKAKATGEQS